MEILGIGPLEFFFILIIALIVLGPKDMVKAGRTIGKFLRKVVTSPTWQAVNQTSNELRRLPNRLMREAGIEEDLKQIKEATQSIAPPNLGSDLGQWQKDITPWTTPPAPNSSKSPPDPSQAVNDSTTSPESPSANEVDSSES
jgi:Sec-independent protein translocase protein TatA